MNFTDQRPFTVTAADLKRPWGGKSDRSRFRCYLCLKQFEEGDTARWVYNNTAPGGRFGNFFTCSACDGEDVQGRWHAIMTPFMERYHALGFGD